MLRIGGSTYERLLNWHAYTTDDLLEARLRSHYSYGCCNTKLGQIVTVRHLAAQEELDLSNYSTWLAHYQPCEDPLASEEVWNYLIDSSSQITVAATAICCLVTGSFV